MDIPLPGASSSAQQLRLTGILGRGMIHATFLSHMVFLSFMGTPEPFPLAHRRQLERIDLERPDILALIRGIN